MSTPLAGEVRVLREDELAAWYREEGHRVIVHEGRPWLFNRGFCRLLHFMATIPANHVGRPTRACWAYQALLPESDRAAANATPLVHLVRDLEDFDERRLGATARKQLRRCRAALQLVRLRDSELMQTQGWALFSQNARRLGRDRDVGEQRYRAAVDRLVGDPRRLVLGAMDGDRLVAYLETFAVQDTAYLAEIRLGDEARSAHVSGFLHFEASQLYRRSGAVRQVCSGLELPDRPGVGEFKRRWGIPLVPLPARFWAVAPARAMLRTLGPSAYRRATGWGADPGAAAPLPAGTGSP